MYESMEKGRKEARIGLDSEKDIVSLINTDKQFRNLIKGCLTKLGFAIQGEIKARRDEMKADIFIEDDVKIGVSIKSSTKTSFHNLDRRWLERWQESLGMPDNIFKIIKEAILRVARNPKDHFILDKDREAVKDFFECHIVKIMNEIFTHGEKDLKLLMINDRRKYRLYLFKMEDVTSFLIQDSQHNISFSSKGIIKFGNFVTAQRKSGNSFRVTIPKTSWQHPGNQLQFKFSPLGFVEHVEATKSIQMCSVQLA